MKKTSYIILALSLLLSSLVSCSSRKAPSETDTSDGRLSAIESQLADILANQGKDDTEKSDTPTVNTQEAPSSTETSESDTSAPTVAGFTYEVSGESAVITGYNGEETHLVIPLTIDDYKVSAIADSAFADSKIKSVVISSGVESIGWFAFDGCTRLTSVTIPSSVKRIGYSAFANTSSSFTIYCHDGSFAQSYARSYGLQYAII